MAILERQEEAIMETLDKEVEGECLLPLFHSTSIYEWKLQSARSRGLGTNLGLFLQGPPRSSGFLPAGRMPLERGGLSLEE